METWIGPGNRDEPNPEPYEHGGRVSNGLIQARCHVRYQVRYHDGMIRVQVQFTEQQAEALRQRAASERRSVAAVVRDAVDRSLRAPREPDREELLRRARAAFGTFRSGLPDLAENHDYYLAKDFDP